MDWISAIVSIAHGFSMGWAFFRFIEGYRNNDTRKMVYYGIWEILFLITFFGVLLL